MSTVIVVLQPISKEEDEWIMIEKYVSNTHASTHRHYRLKIEEVCRVVVVMVLVEAVKRWW